MIKVKKTTPDSLVRCDFCPNKATQLVLFQKLVLASICDSCAISLRDELGKMGTLKLDYVELQYQEDYK